MGIYVNFDRKEWVKTDWGNPLNTALLYDYDELDDLIAEFIMKINSMNGIKTKFCCSGHYGEENCFYIYFDKISKKFQKQLESIPGIELDKKDLKQNKIVYRAQNIKTFVELLDLHKNLLSLVKDVKNKFEELVLIDFKDEEGRHQHLIKRSLLENE